MIITKQTGDYIMRVMTGLDLLVIDGKVTNRCPECSETLTFFETGDHIAAAYGQDNVAVIVACEGYWCIDPSLVGLPRGQWMSPHDDVLDGCLPTCPTGCCS